VKNNHSQKETERGKGSTPRGKERSRWRRWVGGKEVSEELGKLEKRGEVEIIGDTKNIT